MSEQIDTDTVLISTVGGMLGDTHLDDLIGADVDGSRIIAVKTVAPWPQFGGYEITVAVDPGVPGHVPLSQPFGRTYRVGRLIDPLTGQPRTDS